MVSTLQRRLMMTQLKVKITSQHACRFACGGCVDKDRANYGMMDLSNNYDAHCALCVEDEEDGAGWGGKVVLSTSP